MFPTIGAAEVATILIDAIAMAASLRRWQFMFWRTLAAWLLATSAIVGMFIALVARAAATTGWNSAVTMLAMVGSIPVLFATKVFVLRAMSTSLVFRHELSRPFGWGWTISLPIAVFFLALALGALTQ